MRSISRFARPGGPAGWVLMLLLLPLWPAAPSALPGALPPELPGAGSGSRAAVEAQARALWKEGAALHLEGKFRQAVERFRESIALHPTAEAHTYLGWSLSRLGRLEEAIAACRDAIELDPDYGNPYNDIGAYLIALGRPAEAITWLQRAIRAKRYCCYHYAHFNLGRALLMQGRVAEAERAFERALTYRSDYPPARKALELLRARELRGT